MSDSRIYVLTFPIMKCFIKGLINNADSGLAHCSCLNINKYTVRASENEGLDDFMRSFFLFFN